MSGSNISFGTYLDALKVSKGVNQKQLDPKFEHIPSKIDSRWEDDKVNFLR